MKGLLKRVPGVGALGLALATGYGLGRLTAPSTPASANRAASPQESVGLQESQQVDTMTRKNLEGEGSALPLDQLQKTLGMTNPRIRDREMENALSRASLDEVKRALEWASALPESAARRSLLGKIMERWGQLDGANAAAYGEKLFARRETRRP